MADKLLKSIKFPTLPDRYVIGDSTLTEEGAAADAKAVGDALAKKADTKGTYEDLIVGGAEQLMADEYETDKDPYLFRPTGGSADVGNREYLDKIVGGTVAWNQQMSASDWSTRTVSGVTFTNNGDGSYQINGTATGNSFVTVQKQFVNGHVYYLSGCPEGGSRTTYFLDAGANLGGSDVGNGFVGKCRNNTGGYYIRTYVMQGTTVDNLDVVPMLIDLTALFNPTIADYIYSLEQSQAGAGVAWFKKLFPKDYYPYDPGTLRSVEGISAHETVGFNQWDEEWELGGIDSSGNTSANTDRIRSKNFVPILPNTAYYFKVPSSWRIFYYDANMNFISYIGTYSASRLITTPNNAHYLKFYCVGTTYNNDICINLSDPTRNGEYEPYQKHTYPLDSSLTLRGVPKLVDGKLAFDGDVYPPSGEVQRRYGIVDLGTLTWLSGFNGFYTEGIKTLAKAPSSDANSNIVCSKYETNRSDTPSDKTIRLRPVGMYGGILVVLDSSYSDASAFKTAMSGVYMVYEKATPTTETAEGYEQCQRCDPSGTEEFVTDSIVPVGHETRYPHDLKKKIETAPDSPSTDGTYLMKRSGGKNTYMALPSTPSANGAYVLTVTVSGGTASYSWTAKE